MALQSPDLVGTVPGAKSNLWSLKARQDIFERRQNGEDWETICKVMMNNQPVPSRPQTESFPGLPNPNTTCHATAVLGKFNYAHTVATAG